MQAPLLVEFKNATICTVQLVQLLYAHDVWGVKISPQKNNFILGSCNRFWRFFIWLYDYQLPLFLLTRACPFMPHSCRRWKKSCTSWYGEYPFLHVVSILYHFFMWFNVSQLVRAFATWWNSSGCRISFSWRRRTADVAPGFGFLWYKGFKYCCCDCGLGLDIRWHQYLGKPAKHD